MKDKIRPSIYRDNINITYTRYKDLSSNEPSQKYLDMTNRIESLKQRLAKIGFESKVLKYNNDLGINPIYETLRKVYEFSSGWTKEFYKELKHGDDILVFQNNNVKIFLTNELGKNLIDIQIENDFESKVYEELLKIIAEELFYDDSNKISETCILNCIVYDMLCSDVFKHKTIQNKYKCIPENCGYSVSKIYNNIAYDDGEAFFIMEYYTAKYSNTESLVDIVKSNAISYFTSSNSHINLSVLKLYYGEDAKIDILKIVSILQERSYNAFRNNLK